MPTKIARQQEKIMSAISSRVIIRGVTFLPVLNDHVDGMLKIIVTIRL